jgi:hypothetical protein
MAAPTITPEDIPAELIAEAEEWEWLDVHQGISDILQPEE